MIIIDSNNIIEDKIKIDNSIYFDEYALQQLLQPKQILIKFMVIQMTNIMMIQVTKLMVKYSKP